MNGWKLLFIKNGKTHFLRFEDGGKPAAPLKIIGDSERHGSMVRFKADPTISRKHRYMILKH